MSASLRLCPGAVEGGVSHLHQEPYEEAVQDGGKCWHFYSRGGGEELGHQHGGGQVQAAFLPQDEVVTV